MFANSARRWSRRAERSYPLFDKPATRSTSIAAAASMADHAPRLRDRVLHFLTLRGDRGATGEEIAAELSLRMSSATARVNELVHAQLVRDSGHTRENSSRRRATVWVAVSSPPTQ
jgi:hypothetical protein